MKFKYYSQYKQDEFLDKVIFSKKTAGFFVDIGAHNGILISNSFFFEKYRNWNGICIEPNPVVYSELVKNRNSVNLNVCIGDVKEVVQFTQIKGYSEMLSGVTNKYDERHVERITNEINLKGGEIEVIDIQMIRLEDISEINNQTIDFISIDTEGNEFDIIKSINFKNIDVKSIVVENNYKDKRIENHLLENDFIMIKCLNTDNIFIKKSEYSINIKLSLLLWDIQQKLNTKVSKFFKK